MNEQAFAPPRFLTVAEVAEMTRVSRMTVYRMVHAGELPAVRVGRSFRVPEAAVQQLIAAGLVVEDSAEQAESSGG
jgi:excisionase family DNA binding protein